MSSKARLVITAVVLENRPVTEVVRDFRVSRSWLYELLARYRAEGEAAFEPRSRRPHTSPAATPPETVDLILTLRKQLRDDGLDAGADTIAWHLAHHHGLVVSRPTIHRILHRHGEVVPDPTKRPRSSYIRFEAAQPNECWQSDFTHYRLATGADTEIITWLDDHARYALRVRAHHRITAAIVAQTFTAAGTQHGYPAATLTDNGMVYTVRLASRPGGRTALEHQLRLLRIVQKNSRPAHPTTCGKVERFQQTMKKWLAAQPVQPATLDQLQALIDVFVEVYNHHRPHRSLPHRATPATVYTARPKAAPGTSRAADTHDRVRTDRIDKSGTVTLRVAGKLRHIGIGRPHAGTHVLLLIQDHHVRIVDAATGELLRELDIDLTRDYQPRGRPTPQRQTPEPT